MGHDHHFNIGGILVPAQKTPDFDKSPKIQAVKSPRTYIRDSGIVQIPNYEALLGHPILGKSWEGFVVETIINALPWDIQPSFYRTSAGAEIDLVLEFGLLKSRQVVLQTLPRDFTWHARILGKKENLSCTQVKRYSLAAMKQLSCLSYILLMS